MFINLFATGLEPKKEARPSDTVDEKLILKIAKQDKTAFTELYTQTKSAVYGFALSILKNKYTAEDVMQDTYLKIFVSASSYMPQGKPMAWILTIVRNLSLMKLREKKKNEISVDDCWELSDKQDQINESLDNMLLSASMKILSDEERQIVILHSITGLKHREIADLLQIPISTVLSKNRRALAKLKKFIEEDDE